MTPISDTPLKRFSAFWLTLGLFFLFGLAALVFGTLAGDSDEASAADEANAERRLAILETVNEEQAKNLAPLEAEDSKQVPPAEAFKMVSKQLLTRKPVAVKDERQRDPAIAAAASAATEPAGEETPSKEKTEDSSKKPASDSPSERDAQQPAGSPATEQPQPTDSPA